MPQQLFPSVFPIACDVCTHAIRDANQGMLLWVWDIETGKTYRMFIVHNVGHSPDCNVAVPRGIRLESVPLWEATDIGGLIMLCDRLKEEPCNAATMAEAIQRLHVPGYDRIRFLERCKQA